jgi:HAMP domain-containing protein
MKRRRLAASIWLPWILGVVSLLALAVGAQVYGGRIDTGIVVPTAVLDAQQATTGTAAQQVRRSLNAGLTDVVQLADGLAYATRTSAFAASLAAFSKRFHRYRTVYLLDTAKHVVAHTGGGPHPTLIPAKISAAGMTGAVKPEAVPVVVQYAPVKLTDHRTFTLAAEYDAAYLRYSLTGARPATVWVVDRGGKVIASTAGFTAFQQLADTGLRHAASKAHSGSGVATTGGSQAAKDVVAYAAVHGDGPASDLSWGVVTSRSVDTVALPQIQARHQATLFAVLLTALAVGIFGWMLVLFLIPLRRLVHDAERLADGDLEEPVEVRRLDEVGLVGGALERVRVRLIRAGTKHTWSGV